MVFLAGRSPNVRSYAVDIYGCGQLKNLRVSRAKLNGSDCKGLQTKTCLGEKGKGGR
jgi:hypothetical protein